jgi:hypothetical protein
MRQRAVRKSRFGNYAATGVRLSMM